MATLAKDQTRQFGPIETIRADHINRYLFAAGYLQKKLPRGARVLDAACGCGYGSWLLHGAGFDVTSVDISEEAIAYAKEQYQGPTYHQKSVYEIDGQWDAIVSFETLEHLDRPEALLARVKAPILIASVPNENLYPFVAENFAGDSSPHLRHYTPDQFSILIESSGRRVVERFCQKTKIPGDVEPGTDGKFIIYVCEA